MCDVSVVAIIELVVVVPVLRRIDGCSWERTHHLCEQVGAVAVTVLRVDSSPSIDPRENVVELEQDPRSPEG